MKITDKMRLDYLDSLTTNVIVLPGSTRANEVSLNLMGRPFRSDGDGNLIDYNNVRQAIDAAIRESRKKK